MREGEDDRRRKVVRRRKVDNPSRGFPASKQTFTRSGSPSRPHPPTSFLHFNSRHLSLSHPTQFKLVKAHFLSCAHVLLSLYILHGYAEFLFVVYPEKGYRMTRFYPSYSSNMTSIQSIPELSLPSLLFLSPDRRAIYFRLRIIAIRIMFSYTLGAIKPR